MTVLRDAEGQAEEPSFELDSARTLATCAKCAAPCGGATPGDSRTPPRARRPRAWLRHLKSYYVYILTNARRSVLYVGVTSNLAGRLRQHESPHSKSFTARYRLHLLVYFEVYSSPQAAIDREKQLKAGSREDKLQLINATNPDWRALRPDGSPLDE